MASQTSGAPSSAFYYKLEGETAQGVREAQEMWNRGVADMLRVTQADINERIRESMRVRDDRWGDSLSKLYPLEIRPLRQPLLIIARRKRV